MRSALPAFLLLSVSCRTVVIDERRPHAEAGEGGSSDAAVHTGAGATGAEGGATGAEGGADVADNELTTSGGGGHGGSPWAPLVGSSCAERPATCNSEGEDPETTAGIKLQMILNECSVCYFEVEAEFDVEGCATLLKAPESDFECVAAALEAERWPCAAGQKVGAFIACTVK